VAVSQRDPSNNEADQPGVRTERPASAPPTASRPPPSTSPDSHGRPGAGWIAAALAVLVVLAAYALTVPANAPAHRLWVTATDALAQRLAGPQVAAVQAVIQKANSEQSQALASGDSALMSDTATAAYYRQLVQTNQSLAAQGVTSIKLVALTWGPVTIDGTTATAATTETWTTTLGDGTTVESVDANVYTLVQQGGTWLIETDQQPASTQATPSAGVQAPAPAQPTPPAPLPADQVDQNTSHNWSGYAAASGRYTAVTGTWTVPQPRLSDVAAGVGATWVGIGGVTGHDLIQAGTQEVTDGQGQAQFQTWIEMLPQPPQQVAVAVVPGDSVTVSIDEQGAGTGTWQVSITNNTSGQSYRTVVNYVSTESSAEWVDEAPASQRAVLPLDDFGTVSFSAASATRSDQTVNLAQAGAQPITMLNAARQPLAQPSPIGSDGSSFSVTRTSAPATTGPGLGRRPGGRQPTGGRDAGAGR
jgi:hypothetical protein